MIFAPPSREFERLPIIHRDAVGRAIETRDQVGIMRLLPKDRVRVIEERDNYALCAHAACTSGLLLIRRCDLTEEGKAPALPTSANPEVSTGDATL